MKLQGKAILIRPDEGSESPSGIIIPNKKEKSTTGEVVDCGSECELVNKGSKVHYRRQSSSTIIVDGEQLMIAYEEMILYVE